MDFPVPRHRPWVCEPSVPPSRSTVSENGRFSWNLELEDEVFISEVLETVFSNLEDTFDNYKIPKDVEASMHSDFVSKMKSLVESYPEKQPAVLYESLKQLRYITTLHQLTAWQNYDKPILRKRTYYRE